MKKIYKLFSLPLISLSLFGCATTQHPAPPAAIAAPNPDPYEHVNRKIYSFNDHVDHFILRPIAQAYVYVTPAPIQSGVTNFFNNITSLTTIPNDLLQGKGTFAASDFWRFLINSTAGIGGIFDVASHVGIVRHREDFGLTLAYWDGDKPQPYVMLPLLGPATSRDAVGMIADYATSPWPYVEPEWASWAAIGVKAVSTRANLLPADRLVANSFDPYTFIRDAYLQKRALELSENRLGYEEYYQLHKPVAHEVQDVTEADQPAADQSAVSVTNQTDMVTTDHDAAAATPVTSTEPAATTESATEVTTHTSIATTSAPKK